jgi:hypothetical protein
LNGFVLRYFHFSLDLIGGFWGNLECGFGSQSWTSFEIESSTSVDLLQCIQLLLGYPPFGEHMVYGPMRIFDTAGRHIYNELFASN